MATVNMSIRMDTELKRQAEAMLSEMGLNMTTAMNIFLKQVVRQGKIPFEISLNQPNAETLEAMEEVEAMKKNPLLGKTYTNVDDMMRELLN
ncbi:MAG: type II toxin-antitoxin system RelB/DinJ family antitoxin [Clostridia bacterium]|nr:type II toxin-antitoxin system RelB/DinJ family antitoxin [Clostridia bacterium]